MEFKVSSKSDPRKVAGAILRALDENPTVTLNAIGAAAVNQAVKAIAIARRYAARDIICLPNFTDAIVNGRSCTVIQISIKQIAA
jgi:stage V sporulation protein S